MSQEIQGQFFGFDFNFLAKVELSCDGLVLKVLLKMSARN